MFLISAKQKPQAMTYCTPCFSDVIFFRTRDHFFHGDVQSIKMHAIKVMTLHIKICK